MLRAIFLILIVAVVALIIAIQTGFLDISQTRSARVPTVSADENGVTTAGGQSPEFDVQTGSVGVGSREANVTVPVIEVRPPEAQQPAAPATNTAN
jgi:hypothetical protein